MKVTTRKFQQRNLTTKAQQINYLDKIKERTKENITHISLEKMINFCGQAKAETLVRSAQFLQQELPIRLARQYKRLQFLSMGMGMTPSMMKIKSWHIKSFQEIDDLPKIKTESDEENFTEILKSVHDRHSPLLFSLSKSFYEIKSLTANHYNSLFPSSPITIHEISDHFSHLQLQNEISNFLISRIGIRFLIGQHIALKKQLQSNDVSSDSPFVGLVCKKVKPYDVAKEAIADASYVCEREYGRVPNVVLEGLTSMSFPYISSHVYYILFEILKNSMAATLEFHSNKDPSSGGYLDSNTNSNPLPPIKMIIADGEEHEDCSIRISDEGGGMPRSRFDRAFDFGFSTKQIDLSKVDDIEDFTTSMPMSGLGVGLTVSRLYCKYFGGDIRMVPMEGYGTDTYIYLHRLLEKSEPHV